MWSHLLASSANMLLGCDCRAGLSLWDSAAWVCLTQQLPTYAYSFGSHRGLLQYKVWDDARLLSPIWDPQTSSIKRYLGHFLFSRCSRWKSLCKSGIGAVRRRGVMEEYRDASDSLQLRVWLLVCSTYFPRQQQTCRSTDPHLLVLDVLSITERAWESGLQPLAS